MRWKSMSVIIAGALMVAMLAACGEDATPTPTQAPSTVAPVPTQAPSTDTTTPDTAMPDDTMTEPDDGMTMAKEDPVLGGIWDYERNTPDGHDPYSITAGFLDLNFSNSLIQMRFPFNPAEGIQFEPYLATEWTVSEDGSKWQFKLREGVTWHDGEVFDADDVVATVERLLDREWLVNAIQNTVRSVVKGVEKIGEYEVEIDTGSPDATAMTYFRSHYLVMVPQHIIKGVDPASDDAEERWTRIGVQDGHSGTYLIGTGPFKVKDWALDVELNGVKNENYFKFDEEGRRLPYMDQVRYHNIIDPIRRAANFVAGNTEYSQGGGAGMTLRDASALCRQSKDGDGCKLVKWPHGFGTITNNTALPMFKDPKVNAAHRYAHNVEYPLNASFAGGSPWLWVEREYWPDSTLSVKEQYELLPWSNLAREEEFEAKAHELLADAGYADGVDLPFPFFAGGGSGGNPLCYGSFLDQYSRHMDEIYNAGFKTILECRSGVVYDDEMLAGRWSIWGYYPATSLIDPSTGIIQAAVKDSRIMVYLKNGGWIWDELDTLDSRYRVIQKTVDPAQQKELLKDFERYMVAPEQPHFVTYYARVYMSVRECVHNYWPAGIWHSHQWSLEQVWITGDCQSGN